MVMFSSAVWPYYTQIETEGKNFIFYAFIYVPLIIYQMAFICFNS